MGPVKLDELQWNSLVKSILDKRCVLFIGPMLAAMREVYEEDKNKNVIQLITPAESRQWSPIYFQLALHLANILKQYNVDYDLNYQTDLEYVAQRFLEIDRMAEIDLKGIADEFITQYGNNVPEVYERIRTLPVQFSLIVNTSPDTYLHRILDQRNHQFEWYNYEESRDPEIADFSSNYPLLYNLVGKVGETKSLVLTEGQQLTFVKRIIQNDPKVPDKIVNKLNPPKTYSSYSNNNNEITYLFLGFNFERWQFRMLLDRLNISDQSKTIAPSHPWLYQERRTAEFYKSRFNFLFVEDQVEQFLQTLREKLGAHTPAPGGRDRALQEDDIPQLYFSYHNNDRAIVDKLLLMFKLLEKNRTIRVWHQGIAKPGDLNVQINTELRRSRFLMPLLSLSYLGAGDANLQTEAGFAFSEHWNADKNLIPVLAADVPIGDTDFANALVLPRNGKPLDDSSWGGDRGIKQVYDEFKDLIQTSSNQRNP